MTRVKSKRSTGWSNHRIKYELAERGYSLSRIAREHGYNCTSTPGDAMRKPFPTMERIIAGIIGVHPKVIWPGRYNADGSSKHITRASWRHTDRQAKRVANARMKAGSGQQRGGLQTDRG